MPDPFSRERLLRAWLAYRRGKRRVRGLQEFEMRLEEEIESLARDLAAGRYRHGPYRSFMVCDPKPRRITAALLRDRIVHQVVFEEVERAFEPTFLDCSYSARRGRGVHAAVDAAERVIAVLRARGVWPVWALKADVRKFYDSVDHGTLERLIARRVHDPNLLAVIHAIVSSHASFRGPGKGLPIGNLTSQVFANVYLHELDRYAKHTLHLPVYLRYADDVLLMGRDRAALIRAREELQNFLGAQLGLSFPLSLSLSLSLSRIGLENSRAASTGSGQCSGRTAGRSDVRHEGGSCRNCSVPKEFRFRRP